MTLERKALARLTALAESHLDKKWNGIKPSDDNSVVDIPGQDVQSSCAALHYLLHTHTLLKKEGGEGNQTHQTSERYILTGGWHGYAPQTVAGCLPCWCAFGYPGEL